MRSLETGILRKCIFDDDWLYGRYIIKEDISASEVERYIEEKGLFYWGYGQAFQWLLQCLQETHQEWIKNIHFIVDTNRAKQGTFLHIIRIYADELF